MKKEQLNFAKVNQKLQLKGWDFFWHHQITFYFTTIVVILPFFKLFHYLKGNPKPYSMSEIISNLILLISALLFYILQTKRLEFKGVETNLNKGEINSIIERVSEKLKWLPLEITNEYFIAKTRPSFFSGSWGEKITIIFDENKILVNSICDPDQKYSVVSMGRNRKNMNILINEIKETIASK